MEKKVELANSISSLVAKASIAVGAVIVLIYCTSIGFYPKNIQIGDGLFFIWSTLVFGFVCTLANFVFTSVGYTLYTPLYLFLKKFAPLPKINDFKGYSSIYIFGSFVILITLIAFFISDIEFSWKQIDFMLVVSWCAALLMNGFILSALLEERDEAPKKLFYVVTFLMLFIVPFVVIKGFFKNSVSASMKYLGIRETAVTAYVDHKYRDIVSDAINKIDSKKHVIIPVGNEFIRLDNVNILFQGVGEFSYLQISYGEKSTIFNLPSESVIVKKDSKKAEFSDLSKDILSLHSTLLDELKVGFNPDSMVFTFNHSYGLYGVGEYKVSERFNAVLEGTFKEILPTLIKNDELIESIEIIGSASREWKNSEDDVDAYKNNILLSTNRAIAVSNVLYESEYLIKYGGWLNKKVVAKGMSSSATTTNNELGRNISIKVNTRLNKSSNADGTSAKK
ncbi:MAG: hypothetical protein ABJV04_07300 [Aliiglaciecola sp.]|uniref:hypothetical protein n=1 Tax=Aliiglaciecola sp. TaxID=1872441 RepID=UPI0032987ECA